MRLMAALDGGQAAGGDKRGMQSAAMVIVKKNGGVWLNNDVVLRLQVDDIDLGPEVIIPGPVAKTARGLLGRSWRTASRCRLRVRSRA